jgi:twinkle protein
MRRQTWADVGIELPAGASGEVDLTCPQCSHTRKKRTVRCLSVNTSEGVWICFHCGWSGSLFMNATGYSAPLRPRITIPAPPRAYTIPKPPPGDPLPSPIVQWFADRGIPEHVLLVAGITAGQEWFRDCEGYALAIRFPYFRNSSLVNIKYRTLNKHFRMVPGAERILYGLDGIAGAETVCIVEGEIDKLSIDTAGGPPTVSVPDGAPAVDARHYASKFAFLDETAMAHLTGATTVLVATDMDEPGQKLADELARRISHATCKRVSWHPYKDANEMLVAQGPPSVLDALAAAQPFPTPVDDPMPHGTRSVRLLPPPRGRRRIIELAPVEVTHAR